MRESRKAQELKAASREERFLNPTGYKDKHTAVADTVDMRESRKAQELKAASREERFLNPTGYKDKHTAVADTVDMRESRKAQELKAASREERFLNPTGYKDKHTAVADTVDMRESRKAQELKAASREERFLNPTGYKDKHTAVADDILTVGSKKAQDLKTSAREERFLNPTGYKTENPPQSAKPSEAAPNVESEKMDRSTDRTPQPSSGEVSEPTEKPVAEAPEELVSQPADEPVDVSTNETVDPSDGAAETSEANTSESKQKPSAESKESKGSELPTLKPQPEKPIGKITLIECRGGSDKASDGHRKDTIPICNAIIERGWECQPIFYSDSEYKMVEEEILSSKGYICRVNPGTYDDVTQSRLDNLLNSAVKKGVKGMSSPESMKRMGAKDALVKIRDLRCGLPSTAGYYTMQDLEEGFKKTLASGNIRVLKQNRGSQGEGIWVCSLKEGEEKKNEDGKCSSDAVLKLQEAVDNHKEEKTIEEFLKFCKRYLDGEGGQLVDQEFLPRIVEGEVRVLMIGDTPIELIHKKPAEGGISATLKSGALYIRYAPDDEKFSLLMRDFKEDLPKLMDALEIGDQPLPLIWTIDFIPGTIVDGKDTYYVGEFNCSCVGITKQLNLAGTVADAAIKVCEG